MNQNEEQKLDHFRGQHRLPKFAIPHRYDLTLKPNLDSCSFSGVVTVNLSILDSTRFLVLNSIDLLIHESSFTDSNNHNVVPSEVVVDNDAEMLVFVFNEPLSVGDGVLEINFSGFLNECMKGFYKGTYVDGGVRKNMAMTNFEPADARLCFPCWDEPALKATFKITVGNVPLELTALSNMPVSEETINGEFKTVCFEETPIMSTYLVAVVVGLFDYIEETTPGGIRVRSYCPVGTSEKGKLALTIAVKSLELYTKYFSMPYTLPKLDMVGVPDFPAGAMENYGLITFRESELLHDDLHSAAANTQRLLIVVTHEVGHQWFGNLVTMEWWTHLWLNEGFATWVSYLATDYFYPEWRIWTQFLEETASGLKLDSLEQSHPVEVEVQKASSVIEVFDAISYEKGSSLIRMLKEYLGDEIFQKSMSSYMKKYAYKNAKTDDLWSVLSEESGVEVNKFMDIWTKQTGYPVIYVKLEDYTLQFEQPAGPTFFTAATTPPNPTSAVAPPPLLTLLLPSHHHPSPDPPAAPQPATNTMVLTPFSATDKTIHNSHKFAFKLSPTNYGYWKAMIQPFLATNSLYCYVDGTLPCPPPMIQPAPPKEKDAAPAAAAVPQPNPDFATWLSNDAHVRMLIISTVSEASFAHVQGDTSRELWLSFERAYAPNTSSREYTLKNQLLRITMKGDESSSDYLNRAREYATALANIKQPIADKDLVMLVVAGLREEYNSLKSTILARQFPTSFIELYSLFADHDYMTQKSAPTAPTAQAFMAAANVNSPSAAVPGMSSVPPATMQALQQLMSQFGLHVQPTQSAFSSQAFYTNRSNNNRGRGRGRNTYNNNNRNHGDRSQGGGNRSQFSWASNQNTIYGTCNRCGIGHIPSQCPNRDPSTIRGKQLSANYADFRSQASSSWLPDTGSTNHVAPDLSSFDTSEPYHGEDNLHVGNGKALPIFHIGSTKFYSPNKTFSLTNILHVPEIKKNLLSVQKFCHDNHVFFEFHSTFFAVKDKFSHITLLTGPSTDGLYSIRLPQVSPVPKVAFSTTKVSSSTWHHRLGHPHHQLLSSMLSKFHLPVLNNSSNSHCNSCSIGKSSKLHLLSSDYKSKNILDLVFCDVWGPAPVTSFDGHHYFLLCVDHYSRFMWFFPLARKSDVYDTFKRFLVMVERQFNTKLKMVQTDWGGEFRNLSTFFTSLGIIHRLSCPHTSEQNGFVERRHRHVVETGLTLLAHSNVPKRFWHFAFDTAVYLINRMPSRTNHSISPFEQVFHHTPNFSFSRIFGCHCFPHLRPYNKNKMDFRSIPCVFLGYSPSHHGYRCFDPKSDRVYIARHVRFHEQSFPYQLPTSPTPPTTPDPYYSIFPTPLPAQPQPTPPLQTYIRRHKMHQPSKPPLVSTTAVPSAVPATNPAESDPQTAHNTPQPTPQTATQPPPQPTPQPAPFNTESSTTQPLPAAVPNTPLPARSRPANLRPNPKQTAKYKPSSFHTENSPPTEPATFTIANNDPKWRNAMSEEYLALIRNGTWSLVPRVSNANIVACKWVYKLKRDQTGAIQRYKARLVAKGFNQQPGIDYHETFSPVVKSTTIRVILSLAVTQQWPLRQLDVQNAFLHGDLQETVYLQQPPGFVDPQKPDHVCLLHKSLYGLKQAPRAWFQRLSTALLSLGFTGSKTDPSLFIYSERGTVLYMLVYVDDIILTGNNSQAIDQVVNRLSSTFAIQDMGALNYFLGVEVVPHSSGILLSQRKYILELLSRAGLSAAKPVPTPITTTANLALGDSAPFDNPVKYRQLVGALQYVTLSRPDITYAVNKVCQFMHSPTENHWSAVKRILRYLQGTSDFGLLIQKQSATVLHAYTDATSPSLTAFSDADWAGCPDDRRSTGGYAIYLGSNLISWSARKQKTVSRSSTESEYKALADTVAEVTWLQTLLHELQVPMSSTPTLWCDNLGATYLSANPVFHARTKHVEVDFHFVREKVAQRKISVRFISTNDQIADVFTKPLPSQRFLFLRSKLQVTPRP